MDPIAGGNSNNYNYPNDPINQSDLTGLYNYHHTYSLWVGGHMTRRQLFRRLRSHFVQIFEPVQNQFLSASKLRLERVGQVIHTELQGMDLPGLTSGDIQVTSITSTSFSIKALAGHPEYPGTVNFKIGGSKLYPTLEVSAHFNGGALGLSPQAYSTATGYFWQSMALNIDNVLGGSRNAW